MNQSNPMAVCAAASCIMATGYASSSGFMVLLYRGQKTKMVIRAAKTAQTKKVL